MLTLLTIWIMVYGSHSNRLYALKDPPTVVRQWPTEAECKADLMYSAMPRARCVEVPSTPSCYNDGSVCTITPVSPTDADVPPNMVQPPKE